MKTRLGWAVAVALGVLVASPSCAEKKSGLMLAVTTDMKAPKDINAVGLTVSTNNVVKYAAIGRVTPDGDVLLPATLAVVEPDDPSATIRIRVVAFQETKTRVLRDVRTSIPSGGKISLLRLPLSFINDKSGTGDIPAAALPSKKNGGAGPTLGAGGGDSDPATALTIFAQTSCKDAEQTVINGECKDAFVDFNSLPEFRPELVGVGDQKDKCFDVKSCFASAIPLGGTTSVDKLPTGEACGADAPCPAGQTCVEGLCKNSGATVSGGDAGTRTDPVDAGFKGIKPLDLKPQTLSLDKTACAISLNGQDPARLNLALVSRDTGECIRPNECYVPLDSGDGGWKPDGNLIKLPSFVCKLLGDDTKGLRLFASTSCNAKKEENPVCAETAPAGNGGDSDGGSLKLDGGATRDEDATVAPNRDAGDLPPGGEDGGTVGLACPPAISTFAKADVDSAIGSPYKPPKARTTTACTAADIAALNANSMTPTASVAGLTQGMSNPCKACAVSLSTAATWGVILDRNTQAVSNFAACVHSTTNNATCGQAIYYADMCLRGACGQCAAGPDEDACNAAALSGVCKATADAIGVACPANWATVAAPCGQMLHENVKYMCGP